MTKGGAQNALGTERLELTNRYRHVSRQKYSALSLRVGPDPATSRPVYVIRLIRIGSLGGMGRGKCGNF